MHNLKFPKASRLSGKKVIQGLFRSGKRVSSPPLQLVCLQTDKDSSSDAEMRVMVSVPKRNFKKAHDRNRLKRQMREAWRLSWHLLQKKKSETDEQSMIKALHIAFIYQSAKKEPWSVILAAMEKALLILARKSQQHEK